MQRDDGAGQWIDDFSGMGRDVYETQTSATADGIGVYNQSHDGGRGLSFVSVVVWRLFDCLRAMVGYELRKLRHSLSSGRGRKAHEAELQWSWSLGSGAISASAARLGSRLWLFGSVRPLLAPPGTYFQRCAGPFQVIWCPAEWSRSLISPPKQGAGRF
jgi:hypothetical protein